ncbi:hypothetical protein [Helicobacter cetorum]|uniref:hypothetical protein n=1 Tax=Helicobacter cetorum TaxID=138563 RepID=UPI000CF16A3A|nr:hypothetical protein [Helicobacter cetorum]
MVKKFLLGLLFLSILKAGHYEIITEISKVFLKAKNDFLELNQTFKTCIGGEDNHAQIRAQSSFLGRTTTLEQQFYDYFEQDLKDANHLKNLLKEIENLELEAHKTIPCATAKNPKAFEELKQSIKQIIHLESKMDKFLDDIKK